MASFAKIGLNNKVIEVLSVHNNELLDSNGVEQETIGIDFLTKLTGWSIWKQTSYNTHGGIHKLGGTPLRKNFASVGGNYDHANDAFYEKQPNPSWTLNNTTYIWECPVAYPDDGNMYTWNETDRQWDEVT